MAHVVMDLTMRQKRPRHDLNSALRTLHLYHLPILKRRPCPRRQHIIRLNKHPARRVACMASHTHCLPRIRPEADTAEETCKDFKRLLQPLRLGLDDKFIVRIKVRCQVVERVRDVAWHRDAEKS